MKYIVNSSEMMLYDFNTIHHYGILSPVLMERAALSVVEEITSVMELKESRITVLCGPGNNGGDGFAVARILFQRGAFVQIYFPFLQELLSEDALQEYNWAVKYQIPIHFSGSFTDTDLIVDALFGTGLRREIKDAPAALINAANASSAFRVAVDIPSGISADTGSVLGTSFLADLTVTFSFGKIGHFLYPGTKYCGKTVIKDIGIDSHSFLGSRPGLLCHTPEDLILYPRRNPDANKSSAGKLLIIAGSMDIAGAAYLCAAAACRMGCGFVRVFTVEKNRPILQQMLPQAVIVTDLASEEGSFNSLDHKLKELLDWADAAVIGPGIGLDLRAVHLLEMTLQFCKIPIVIDADALTILADRKQWMETADCSIVLTPHPGEMARLSEQSISDITDQPLSTARDFISRYQVTLVQKNARSVIAGAEGCFLNISGNDGMASAGSGDVLAGCIGGMLAQGALTWLAATLGTYIHGLAGDNAREKHNPFSMGPEEIIKSLELIMNQVNELHNRKQKAGMQSPVQEA